ncbi:MAG: DUF433 domain-containing protein [Halobaculum sp.]
MTVAARRVSRREGVKSGRPTVRGSKVSVVQLLELTEDAGLTPAEIAAEYTDIDSVEVVREALSWADDHPEEVARLRRQRETAKDRLRETGE